MMLDKGANINAKSKENGTALMLASQNGHDPAVKILIDNGADVNAIMSEGWTALMLASENGHDTIVKMLLEKGADVNIKNNLGETALDIAKREGHQNVINMLSGGSVLRQLSKSQKTRGRDIPQIVQALGTPPPFNPMMPMYPPNPVVDEAWDTLKSLGIVIVPYLIDQYTKLIMKGF